MHTLAAIALSLASATAPASADPGAGPVAASAQIQAAPQAAEAAIAPPIGSAAEALNQNLLGSAHAAPQIVGTPMIGTPTDSSSHGFPAGSAIPLAGLVICGAAAVFFAKKKQIASPKMLEILESHSVGGRQKIIVAKIAGETVILGSSEAGLTLLLARPGETVAQLHQAQATQNFAAAPAPQPALKTEQKQSSSWLGKLRIAKNPEPELSFEDLLAQDTALRAQGKGQPIQMAEPALLRHPIDPLAETAEDTELRRKLAQGRSGRIA